MIDTSLYSTDLPTGPVVDFDAYNYNPLDGISNDREFKKIY